jgi:hypothetical protein
MTGTIFTVMVVGVVIVLAAKWIAAVVPQEPTKPMA